MFGQCKPNQTSRESVVAPKKDQAERLSHVLQLRLNDVQRNYLVLLAEDWECGLGEAARRCIEEHLEGDQSPVDGLKIGGRPATLREALERVPATAPSDWLDS